MSKGGMAEMHLGGSGLGAVLRRWADRTPDALAVTLLDDDGAVETLTYRQLDEAADGVAARLLERGIGLGDRLAVMSRNHLALPEVYLGALRVGAVLVPVNVRYTASEIGSALSATAPLAAIIEREFEEHASLFEAHGVRVIGVLDHGQSIDWAEFVASRAREAVNDDLGPKPHMILFTSGTTGASKGVVQTHDAYLRQTGLPIFTEDGCQPGDVVCCMYSLFHSSGWRTCLIAWQGGAEALILRRGSASLVESALLTHGTTILMALPDTLRSVGRSLEAARRLPTDLRALNTGTERISQTDVESWLRAFGVRSIRVHYGSSEAGPISHDTITVADDASVSVGRPWPGIVVKIVDPAAGLDVEPGTVGEVVVDTPYVMAGYLGSPELTRDAFRDGFYRTRDTGRLDDGGRLHLTGRVTDAIRSGGEWVFPAEVEAVIAGVRGVRDVAVVGVAHPRWHERPVAFVEADAAEEAPPTAVEIDARCATALAHYKRPDVIYFVDELPRVGATNKVDRVALREFAGAAVRGPQHGEGAGSDDRG
jgi:fatty-acyl-CoA synthase